MFYTHNGTKARMSNDKTSYPRFSVLMPAAGTGARFSVNTPKQYIEIAGKPMLTHTVSIFEDMPECIEICVIIDPAGANRAHEALKGFKKVSFTQGSESRKSSVHNGLKNLSHLNDEDIVLIHDAARPCVSKDNVYAILKTMKTEKAASLAMPVVSTLRKSEDNDYTSITVERENLWEMQTPQAFIYGDILKAHEQFAADQDYTDDTTLVSRLDIPVKLVRGHRNNIKITTPDDLAFAEFLLEKRKT